MVRGVDDLAPLALAIVSLVVVVGVGSVVLGEMEGATFDQVLVEDETHQPDDQLPSNFTVDAVDFSDYEQFHEGSETLWLDQTGDGENLETLGSEDYEPYYEEGTFELQDSETLQSYNTADGDEIVIEYEYDTESEATSVLDKGVDALSTFGDFFVVLVVIGIAAAIFMLLSVLKRTESVTR